MSYKVGDIRNLIIGKTEDLEMKINVNVKTRNEQVSKSDRTTKKLSKNKSKMGTQERKKFTEKNVKVPKINKKSKETIKCISEPDSGDSNNCTENEDRNCNEEFKASEKKLSDIIQTEKTVSDSESSTEDEDDVIEENFELEIENNADKNVLQIEPYRNDESLDDFSDKDPENEKTTKKNINSLSEDEMKRTIFVGNWPLNRNKKKLSKYFSKYGKVESSRLRSIPVGDPNQSKKVAYITKNFQPKRTSCEGYVKFENKESAFEAVKENGAIIDDHHLMVNVIGSREKPNDNKAIFVGNLPFECEHDELWNAFHDCGKINNIHIARNTAGMSRGFGFINFDTIDSVELALKQSFLVKNRELRVKRVGDKSHEKQTFKDQNYNMKRKSGNVHENNNKRIKLNDFSRQKMNNHSNGNMFNNRKNNHQKFNNFRNKTDGNELNKVNSNKKIKHFQRNKSKGDKHTFNTGNNKKQNQFQGFKVNKSQGMRKRKLWTKNDKQKKKIIEKLNPRKEK